MYNEKALSEVMFYWRLRKGLLHLGTLKSLVNSMEFSLMPPSKYLT